MLNSFETNFQILIEEMINDAHVRLNHQDREYKEKSSRMAQIYEELDTLLENKTAKPTSHHWELVREYLDLDLETYYPEHTATYIQALFDCMGLLARLGWIKQ